jgi:hypothetical protein
MPLFLGSESSFNLSPIQSIRLPAHSRVTGRSIRLTPVSQNTRPYACRPFLPFSESMHFLPLILTGRSLVDADERNTRGMVNGRGTPVGPD